jgi:hypothetical protein
MRGLVAFIQAIALGAGEGPEQNATQRGPEFTHQAPELTSPASNSPHLPRNSPRLRPQSAHSPQTQAQAEHAVTVLQVKNKTNKLTDASAYFLYQGWFAV